MTLHLLTHADQFHADELLAIALLLKCHGLTPHDLHCPSVSTPEELGSSVDFPATLVRTREPLLLQAAAQRPDVWMIDVGASYDETLRNFDHHHDRFTETWPNGRPLSSAGLVWRHLRQSGRLNELGPTELLDALEQRLIAPVDAHDNGLELEPFSITVADYNRGNNRVDLHHTAFLKALTFTCELLDNRIFHLKNELEARTLLKEAWRQACEAGHPDLVILTRSNPHPLSAQFLAEISEHRAQLYLTLRKKPKGEAWSITTLPDEKLTPFSVKCPTPSEWAGRSDFTVDTDTGPVRITFSHKARFFTIVDGDLKAAMAVARQIVHHRLQPTHSTSLEEAANHVDLSQSPQGSIESDSKRSFKPSTP